MLLMQLSWSDHCMVIGAVTGGVAGLALSLGQYALERLRHKPEPPKGQVHIIDPDGYHIRSVKLTGRGLGQLIDAIEKGDIR